MAKKVKMVTRTIKVHTIMALCVNAETEETFNHVYVVSRNCKNASQYLKEIKALEANPDIEPVRIISMEDNIKRYGLPEQEFISIAQELEPLKLAEEE